MSEEKKDTSPPASESGAGPVNADASADQDQTEARTGARPDAEGTQLPAIDFSTFVISLNSSALVQLGILEEPGSGKKTKNLAIAKQTIDVLAMLEEKTKGNLNPDEENMLKSLLYDLRILYVREKS